MLRPLFLAAMLLGGLLLTGCASVINGTTQSVSVVVKNQGDEVAGAKCSLTNDKGVWYVTTPGAATVHRAYGDLTVSCQHADMPDGTTAVKSATTAAVFGNILLGGGIGAGVDIASGAAYHYPTLIPVNMGVVARLEAPPPAAPAKGVSTQPVAPDPDLAALRVPYIDDARQAKYQEFLTRPLPRAIAIAGNNHIGIAWTAVPYDKSLPTDPGQRALIFCQRAGGVDCVLYVVDNRLVFVAPPQAQVSPASQEAAAVK